MIRNNNIFSKFLLLLLLAMGWGSGAWAQTVPVEGKIYYIKAKFANANDDSYLTNGGSMLTFPQNASKSGSYWIAERSGNSDFQWRFKSVLDGTKYLNANATSGLGDATNIYSFFNIINCGNVPGLYHLNGRIGNGDTRTNLNIGTWGFNNAKTGFGRRGDGAWGQGESNVNWTTDYEIVECFLLNGNTNIKFVDASGNPLLSGEVNFTQANGTVVKISGATYDFGDIVCPVSSFTAANINKRLISVEFNAGTLTFKLADEQWFTIKNHRRNDGYFSVSDAGLNTTQQMQWGVTSANANTAAEYWCMKEDGNNGLRIYNKAYGLDYVLGIEGTGNGSRVRMYHVSEANATNTHFDKVNSNTAGEFCIMLHSNHGVALHDYSSQLGVWSHNESGHKGDVGSAYVISNIDNAIINAIPDYTVYKVDVLGSGRQVAIYGGNQANHIGQVSVQEGRWMLLKSTYNPDGEHFNYPEVAISNSTSNPIYKILTLSGEEKVPTILHRASYLYAKLASEPNKPVYGHIGTLEADDDGMSTRKDGIREQKTSVFEIPVYLKPGNNPRDLYLPSDRITYYQRWFNYDTDGLVDPAVMPSLYSDNYRFFKNGHVSGAINSGTSNKGYTNNPRLYLPESLPTEVINGKTFYKDYLLTMDISRYKDNGTSGFDFVEPTLSQRVIYRIMDANKIATEIKAKTDANDWYEKREIIFPCKKRGEQSNNNTGADLVPLNMDLWNYWGYNSSNQLVQLTGDGQISVELDASSTAQLAQYGLINGRGGISRVNFNQGHFITFTYPTGNVAPDNSKAVLNVYFTAGNVRYNLAQFTLTFQPNVEPKLITDVIGKDGEEYISSRSPHAMTEEYGNPVAQLQFDNVRVDMVAPAGGVDNYNAWGGWNLRGEYAFPLDFSMSSYGYGYGSDSGTSRGEYGIYKFSQATGGGVPKYTFYPVKKYFDNILKPEEAKKEFVEDNDYIIYVDAADQAGQVMSIPIAGGLCPGTRLFCYGWMASNAGASNPSSVILSIVGHKSDGTTAVLSSYCPGILSAWGYRDEDNARIYSFNPTDQSVTTAHGPASNWGLWQQIGFSFMLDRNVLDTYNQFSLLVYNNCYNSSGGDYLLDNFQIFANPPKGNVDFTTPLCSDKVRHAKVNTDFDMLKNLSVQNENDPEAQITATYCFLDAEIFDNFEEGGLRIGDMFVMDDKGNHDLKPIYHDDDPKVISIINHAFRQALVGSRYTKESGKKDHGFHTHSIPLDFESIPPYAYNDSKPEFAYREVDAQGVRRLVFKENIERGEMQMEPAEEGERAETHPAYWPYMRPSRTYYLVFSPILATQTTIDKENTATDIFHIQESCSFFGKFTTKDPMHVILDNADIESDLPIRAVCHGETATFSFDMPAMKMVKDEHNKLKHPIIDEVYCTSDKDLDGQIVPSTQGLKHYRYEPLFETSAVYDVIRDMPYDWWLGGKFDETHTFRGTKEAYEAATHPTIVYDEPKDKAHKQHGDPVNIAQAMIDFRFFYPDEDGSTWSSVTRKEYNSNTGYGLLDSEIRAIKDFVDKGIIVLHRTEYNMSLTAKNAEKLTPDELSKMTSDELSSQILELALKLDDDPAIKEMLPLKALEGKVLQMISPAGRRELTFQEFANFTHDEYKNIARKLRDEKHLLTLTDEQINAMPLADLRKTIEAVLRAMPDADLELFAKDYFPNVGHVKRAHLVIRALNIMNEETLKDMTEEQRKNPEYVRSVLRGKMIAIFSAQDPVVLRKMWKDTATKLTPEEQAELLNGRDPEDMDAAALGELVEHGLGVITNDIINDLNSDQYIHFTLIPIMPSQKNFVDEPYIFCPEPRGVKIRITTNEPRMFDGFADMPYPNTMDNVPVRVGMSQIKAVPSQEAEGAGKVIKLPLRRLGSAQKNGHEEKRLQDSGYGNFLFLKETNDPAYQAEPVQDGSLVMKPAVMENGGQPGDEDAYKIVGKAQALQAIYSRQDNYMNIQFDPAINFREGYTYRLGFNFMEYDSNGDPTISCYGTMVFDMKVVPEYQKWTGAVSTEWTNDQNWARADRSELHAGNTATGDKIDAAATPLDDNTSYISNEANGTASSFVPMYFTNVLLTGKETNVPELYAVTAASHSEKKFLQGLKAADDIIYDMEVAPAEGNFDCELFGTYVAGGLTFQPKAQLLNAQLLTYKKAWVEYELDVNRWYTLASPLQNTFAGEWYAPTAGGRQQTPHFYGINYRPELNHRFQPAIYQRSWDSEGNNPVYLKTETKVVEAFIKADWSHVYNDVKKEYSEGAFSVKVADEFMSNKPAEGKSLVRMPKADTQYTYYDINNETGQKADDAIAVTANRSRLWTDKFKTSESFSQTIVNQTDGNNFFLVGNPFMTAMDMDKFFEANPDLETKYWIISANQQQVSVRGTGTTWVSTSSDKYVAPLQGFFVKAKSDSQKSLTVTYTAAMQAPQGTKPALKVRGAAQTETRNIIRLVAERDSASSTAVIMLDEQADDNFVAAEDCETFIDGNLYDLPTVFTSAGNVAQTINVRRTLDMVPLGIISADESETTLRFDLRDCHERTLQLFDSETQEYIEITDGTEVPMNGNTVGRYFLCKEPIETSLNPEEKDGIKQGVWTVGGAYLGKSVKNLRPGIYIVDGVKMVIR